MDYFFEPYDPSPMNSFWFDRNEPMVNPLVVNQSAFVKYTPDNNEEQMPVRTTSYNLKKRTIRFLKMNPVLQTTPEAIATEESERERCRRHASNERMRREKQKLGYLNLHSVLPYGTKNEKNTIVKVAAKQVEELKRWKDELERENDMLKSILSREGRRRRSLWDNYIVDEENNNNNGVDPGTRTAKIRLKVAYTSSGIDSMLGVLKCLKQTRSKTVSISSHFSAHKFSATLEVEYKQNLEAAEVEEAVRRTLNEIETLRGSFNSSTRKGLLVEKAKPHVQLQSAPP